MGYATNHTLIRATILPYAITTVVIVARTPAKQVRIWNADRTGTLVVTLEALSVILLYHCNVHHRLTRKLQMTNLHQSQSAPATKRCIEL